MKHGFFGREGDGEDSSKPESASVSLAEAKKRNSRPLRSRRQDAKMTENEIGKEIVDAAVKEGIKRIVNRLAQDNLGVSASLRETSPQDPEPRETLF
jgi:hypothetical protein